MFSFLNYDQTFGASWCWNRSLNNILAWFFFPLSLITPKKGNFYSFQVCKGGCCWKQHAWRRSGKSWVVMWTLKGLNIPSICANISSQRSIWSLGEGIYQQNTSLMQLFLVARGSLLLDVYIFIWTVVCEIQIPKGLLAIVTI